MGSEMCIRDSDVAEHLGVTKPSVTYATKRLRENGYIEIMEYPRADKAIIVDAASGAVTPVEAGETKRALEYEMRDMEEAVQSGDVSRMQMPFTGDVMNIMTDLRKNWGLVYPEESRKTE